MIYIYNWVRFAVFEVFIYFKSKNNQKWLPILNFCCYASIKFSLHPPQNLHKPIDWQRSNAFAWRRLSCLVVSTSKTGNSNSILENYLTRNMLFPTKWHVKSVLNNKKMHKKRREKHNNNETKSNVIISFAFKTKNRADKLNKMTIEFSSQFTEKKALSTIVARLIAIEFN